MGHTAFIMKWFEAPHHFVVNGVGKVLGGLAFSQAVMLRCISHMKAYVILARQTCMAEFPMINVICCFSAFEFPPSQPSKQASYAAYVDSPHIKEKIARLSVMFGTSHLSSIFKRLWWHAWKHYTECNNTWDAWRFVCEERLCGVQCLQELQKVVKRGCTWAPVTSKVEQSFAKIRRLYGEQRLKAGAEMASSVSKTPEISLYKI
jgi:hypothetical protein